MHHTACGPASAWKTTQRYVGAQRTRAKCRCCFTVLSQHDASPRLVHLPGRSEDGPGGARPIRGRCSRRCILPGWKKSWMKQGGVLADRNNFNQPETLPSFLNRRPLPAIRKDFENVDFFESAPEGTGYGRLDAPFRERSWTEQVTLERDAEIVRASESGVKDYHGIV